MDHTLISFIDKVSNNKAHVLYLKKNILIWNIYIINQFSCQSFQKWDLKLKFEKVYFSSVEIVNVNNDHSYKLNI